MGANATSVTRIDEFASKTRLNLTPALRRVAEWARRIEYVVPVLALGFLLTVLLVWVSAGRDDRQSVLNDDLVRLELVGRALADQLRQSAGSGGVRTAQLEAASRGLPSGALRGNETVILFDTSGRFVSAVPDLPATPRSAGALLGEGTPLTVFADRAGALEVTLPDGSKALATLRNVPQGQVAIVQPTGRSGRPSVAGPTCAFALAIGFLGLCAAFARQTLRMRDATTARDQTQRRIERSLTRGRCGLWDWDVSRGRVSWSASMYDILGYDRRDDDLSFGEVNGMIHPSDGDLYLLAERVAASPSLRIDHDFRMRTASGDWLWLRACAEVVTERDGSQHLVGTTVDITDERGFVERHATADMRLRDAVEAVSEAFVLWDAQNRLVLCNSKFRDLHGLPFDKARPGASYTDVMAASRPAVVERQLTHGGRDDTGARTLEAQLSDGRWLHINERRTRDGGYVSVGTDITALKRHEERLLDSERRLMGTVKDLKQSRETLETQKQQLAELAELHLEQKGHAENANRAKTDFLAKMSHELRTPLNAIIGFAEVMHHEMFGALGNPRYLEYSSDIHASGLYLLSVINDILQMSRIEAGHISLSPTPISIRDAIARAVRVVSEGAEEKNLSVVTEPGADIALQADERALNQILVHILRNAVKFTPDDGTIRVRLRRAGASMNIFVEDSGIGIPQEFLSRLGRPFEQVEPEFNRAQGGSGLGLAIAKAFADLHGGGLRIRSQEGVGTVVLVHLPVRLPVEEAGAADQVRFLEAAE